MCDVALRCCSFGGTPSVKRTGLFFFRLPDIGSRARGGENAGAGATGCRAAGLQGSWLLAAGVCCLLAEGLRAAVCWLRAAGGIMGCQIGIFSPYSTTVVGWLPGLRFP
jgi:hypothetical protein